MKVPQSPIVAYGIVLAFLIVPIGVAIAAAARSGGGLQIGQPAPYLWFLAIVTFVVGVSLLSRESRSRTRRSGPERPGTRYALVRLEMLACACFVIAEFLLVVTIDRRVGIVFLGLAVIWALIWTPRSTRRVVARTAIELRCSPAAAFDLVSNPNNWHRYLPEFELVEPIHAPVRVGSLIHGRVHRDGRIAMEGEEEVIAFEPGRRFGTILREAPGRSTATYELEEVPGGTRLQHTFRSAVSLPAAILGDGLRRRGIMNRMVARRTRTLDRIKRLLEDPDPTSV
jgi:hypothetical protein